MLVGLAVEAGAWWLVAFRRLNVWGVMAPVLIALGLAALIAGPPAWSPNVEAATSAAVGLGVGVVLYLATRLFVFAVHGWGTFQRQSSGMYLRRGSLSLPTILGLSVALMVPGEELFWRGLFQVELAGSFGGRAALAAVVSWGAFVLANLASANLAIVAGSVVGGAVWSGLGWWSGGALAPLVCHAAWTALMLSFPVVRPAEATV